MKINFNFFPKNSFYLFVLLTLTSLNAAYAQTWTQTKGPGGGDVIDMVEKNGVIIVATLEGNFRSTDNGDTWSRAVTGLPAAGYMTNVAVTPTYVYTAGWSEGLFRSADLGLTWTAVPINLSSIFILELYTDGEDIYVGCEGAGVIRSTDMGNNFEFANNGYSASANVVTFAKVGNFLFTGLAGNGGSVGVYRSALGGSIAWTQLYVGSVGDIEVKDTLLFMTASGGIGGAGFFRSDDLGITWHEPLPGYNNFGGLLAIYQGDLYTARDGVGIFKSTDEGLSWSAANTGLKPLSAFSYLAGSTAFFVGFERGIARTTDNAVNWDLKSRGLTNTSVTCLLADGDHLYATGRTINAGSNDGVFFTTDAGQNWTSLDQGLFPNPNGSCIIKSVDNLILGTSNAGLYVKRPADIAWIKPAGIPATCIVNCLINAGSIVLAGVSGEGELYRSTDAGMTFTQSNTGFNTNQEDQVYSLYNKAGVMYAGAFNALYKSLDLGLTWTNSSAGIYPGAEIKGITGTGNDLYAVAGQNLGIYKSINDGSSWFSVNNGIPPINRFNALFSNNGILYAGSDNGVYRSVDNGLNWAEYNDGLLFKRNALSFAVLNNNLYVGTDETAVWGNGLTIVPIILQSFTAKENNGIVQLNWATASEINGRYINVERSENGRNFISIDKINVIGNEMGHNYNLDDTRPEPGYNYYRLTLVNNDSQLYSEVLKVYIKNSGQPNVLISPNPANTTCTLKISGNIKGKMLVVAYDLKGSKIADVYAGEMNNSFFSAALNLNSFQNGIYFLKIMLNNETVIRKLIIE